jgi:hypothetical protein
MSVGVNTSGVATPALINKLMKGVTGLGKYEIIYDRLSTLPIELVKFNDYSSSRPDRYIEFTLSEIYII